MGKNIKEYSWSVVKEVAERFAAPFKGRVHTRLVDVSRVVAYLKNRGEYEVLIYPEDVKEVVDLIY